MYVIILIITIIISYPIQLDGDRSLLIFALWVQVAISTRTPLDHSILKVGVIIYR